MASMLTVLNKRWISMGWRAMDVKDSEPMALVFIEALDREQVPYHYYDELYQRSRHLRTRQMSQGLRCDDFSADMMIACWPSLRDEIHQREIDSGRTLTVSAPTQCLRCYGTGFERVYDDDGGFLGTRKGCVHEHLDTSDPYYGGIEQAIAAVTNPEPVITAKNILAQARAEIIKELVSAADAVGHAYWWKVLGRISRIERYVREAGND